MLRIVKSTSAAARIDAAARFISSRPPSEEILVVGASRGAADDLARAVTRASGSTFGITRFSLTELAARAASSLPHGRRTPAGDAGVEAVAARIVFDSIAAHELEYFAPVASMPGFPRALARTLYELRLAGLTPDRLETGDRAVGDLSRLLARLEDQIDRADVGDRAWLFSRAIEACAAGKVRWTRLPLLLLDVAIDSPAERGFASVLIRTAPSVIATIPDGDRALEAFIALGGLVEDAPDGASATSDLAHLRRYVFTNQQPPDRSSHGDVRLFSAPGEGREAVEIVRRVLDEAARGVRFDDMAVFLRAPQHYLGLLEHACARADVPAYFDRGTRRPDPAGRAFLALLSCACEGLSAKRFDEYLSLGQVPRLDTERLPADVIVPRDEVLGHLYESEDEEDPESAAGPAPPADSDDEAIVAGMLRSPWRWEELIVESAVVGGRTRQEGKDRWRRRLDGLANDYRYRIAELVREEPESARIARLERDLRNLAHLRTFALPIVDTLAAWPEQASWGEWLDRLTELAATTLSRPLHVLQTLAELRPMAEVQPVTLSEARDVLHERLATLDWEPPSRRYGRLYIGTPHQARGRRFRVVFVPGLAERLVPQRPREDPLLVDDRRTGIDPALVTQEARGSAERLLLKIAIGAATERLYVSYPRMDVAETRARVPSFYALDVMRAITGRIPDHRALASDAAHEAGASLAWPAPVDPGRAIDDLEHDLAVLRPLLDSRDPASLKGHAHYLLGLNDQLKRSVTSRWLRGRKPWSPSDGLIRVSPSVASAIAAHRLDARPYSLSALQRFATCPYQFLLATIHRLEPWEEPEPLMRMDPLTRGSLFHEVQAEFYRTLQQRGELPVTSTTLQSAVTVLNDVLRRVAGKYAELLAPAIDRVWRDEIHELGRDLGIWVQKLADEQTWVPEYFEFSFGLGDQGRDPRSRKDPVVVGDRFVLRGSVDLVEHRRDLDQYRITDHKTGRNRSNPDLIIGGGSVLQPVLYGVAVEQALGKRVTAGRLYYCTTAGGFGDHEVPLSDYNRGQALQVLTVIDRAVEQGFLVAAPAERACTWCDFRPVCGPREEERLERKDPSRLADLEALRSMR